MNKIDPFDMKLVPSVFGFQNMGATCYFNSLVQALLTCTSLTRIMIKNRNKEEYKNNEVAMSYINMLNTIFYNKVSHTVLDLSSNLWRSVISHMSKKKSHKDFGHGQEDSHESFKLLLECWETLEEVINLFIHKDHVSIYCVKCRQWNNSQNEDVNNNNSSNEVLFYYEIAKGFKPEFPKDLEKYIPDNKEESNLENYLKRQITYIDSGYRCNLFKKNINLSEITCRCRCSESKKKRALNCICSKNELLTNKGICLDACKCPCYCKGTFCDYKCNNTDKKIKLVLMKIIPNILVLMCPGKVYYKYNENFPEFISFETDDDQIIKYRVVSQIIHSGNASGGHYWANAIREDGRWYDLNDTNYSGISGFVSNEGSYVVIYHLCS